MSDQPESLAVSRPVPAGLGRPSILAVERLSKSFGAVEALRDVDFAVNAGEVVARAIA